MLPHRLSGADAVRGHDLLLAALLLRVEDVAVDRKRRPARTDRPAPQLFRRRRRPVGGNAHAAHDAVAMAPRKPGQSSDAFTDSGERRAAEHPSSMQRRSTGAAVGLAAADAIRLGAGAAVTEERPAATAACRLEAPARDLPASASSAMQDRCRTRPSIPRCEPASRPAHARRMAKTIDDRRTAERHGRLTTAQSRNARQRPGTASSGNSMPIAPVASDTSRNDEVAASDANITTIAATRSNHAARLKNSHHSTSPRSRGVRRSRRTSAVWPDERETESDDALQARWPHPGHSRSGSCERSVVDRLLMIVRPHSPCSARLRVRPAGDASSTTHDDVCQYRGEACRRGRSCRTEYDTAPAGRAPART